MPKKNNLDNITEKLKNYCAIQERCQWDLIQKMNKLLLNKKTKDKILTILIKENYLDEERYALAFVNGKFKIKNWGKQKIKKALAQKHISNRCIENSLNIIEKKEYVRVLEKLLRKKKESIKEKSNFIQNSKIANFLIQRGFESYLVWQKIKKLGYK